MKYSIYLVLVVSLLFACTKELPYPDLLNEDLLVMNGLISPETGVNIQLSQSCHITDVDCELNVLENANVFLKDESGNVLTELKHQSKGVYTAQGFEIDYNKNYSVEASSAGLQTITSKTIIPKSFSCKMISNDEQEYQGYLCRTFNIEIEDNPDETNYYLINGWVDILNGEHNNDGDFDANGYQEPHTGFLTKDINAENKSLTSTIDIVPYTLSFVFLKDENFNGETYPLEFGLHDEDLNRGQYQELEAHISVKSVSKELYEYYRSIQLHNLTAANPLGEPQQIFTNIENGIGIFGGFTEKEFVVDLPPSEFWFDEEFTVENDQCTGPCTVRFSINAGEKFDFHWDFGDGNTSKEQNPEHEYQEAGDYQVLLIITSPDVEYHVDKGVVIN